jgi:hypothetical protein
MATDSEINEINSETDTISNSEPQSISIQINNNLFNNNLFNNYLTDNYLDDRFDNFTNQTFNDYIRNRNNFENEMYDYLASSTSFNGIFFVYTNVINNEIDDNLNIDDDFWDPVIVSYDSINLLEDITLQEHCHVCTEDKSLFKKLKCCSQNLCVECCQEWFGRSVKCPYCYQDLRNF